ncbi:MAG: SCO family protein [Flavobacteriales bacterium]|nr:SCO family protein [Flavobacteriales bacterium]
MKKYLGLIIVGLIFIIGSIIAGILLTPDNSLRVFDPADVNPILVDDSLKDLAEGHRVKPFKLLDQHGNETSDQWLDDKVYVIDFFFTTCQSICPIMTSQMDRAANSLSDEDEVRFLSVSVIPQQDSVPVLKAYADRIEIDYDQWRLLTGDKQQIYEMARKSYFVLKPAETGEGDGGVSDFIHTNNFVLVDKQKRIRGYYDGTNTKDVDRLIKEVKILLTE